ncbi:hypothetical protein FEM48_Zijuj12G0160500 [Ziziphus jujuba var. spinosa]|uniref:Fe2OG dioxygenase domain-containing protein n=1 Tax=Ziziphus jujuba var. spinosa TaxID=714518 RepID=A0A978UEA6_ZIZJJ|nr:hypothetical protein FEM48_Zijuj12G0160500 [Ziziphus jujuba var. spinosa]
MKEVPKLPIIDLSSPDLLSTANSLRQYGFFYVVNHGVEEELTGKVFEESNKFFSLPLEDKMKLFRKEDRGYTPLFGEILHPYSAPKGRFGDSGEEIYGASAHSDYGMITLLVSNGVCRDKSKEARVWEDVVHINGAFIVNIGDMMERWTNCLFRSTLHRVMLSGQERYSAIIKLLLHLFFIRHFPLYSQLSLGIFFLKGCVFSRVKRTFLLQAILTSYTDKLVNVLGYEFGFY